MQKIYTLLVFLIALGCANDNKKKKTDIIIEDTILSETSISQPEPDDTVNSIEKPLVNEIKDSIVIDNEITELEEVTENIIEKTTTSKIEKKETVKKEPKKIRPSHSSWDALTKKYVSSTGKVNYNGFKSDISKIESYLKQLEQTPPQKGWTKNEKLAYWFNLYNAATIKLVASSYPIKSIRDINGGKPWDKKFVKSGNKTYSLNYIENKIVRPNFNEPRLHVAFNCAAISCPKLMKGAFFSNKLNTQLNTLSKAWINDPSNNKITKNKVEISKIFEWYSIDFKKGIIPFLNIHATNEIAADATITYLEYNWNLND
ncbi:DUF547 domain-containing protein [Aquimarina sp. 2201CG14-23]|uniref:DUF547 domain-containing protein n=1 Tax=Aquimarina mycalae TaxID=3040073 RepID=UPI002477DDF0|nr:DUF547 domain-containing protein [Aquimarina sp. 2201CG14-23]MDH7445623.1 DUF547 domain-containing protein [Aquimarina sp. 2201CG14-23]